LNTRFKTQDIAVIGISAALYAVFGILTAGFSFLGVGFLPAVVIPAVFAVLYGPWVGGTGAVIGIFIRDMYVHHIPLLSLTAGVPPNFILFFLLGYIAHRSISLKQALVGVSLAAIVITAITAIFVPDIVATLALGGSLVSSDFVYIAVLSTIIPTLAVIAVVAVRWKEWRSYAIAAVIAQASGAALLSVTVAAVSPFFLSYFGVVYGASTVLPLFIWTFVTELPFILLVGPPIIKACYRAFPSLRPTENQGTNLEKS
jgi:hypothetical protein